MTGTQGMARSINLVRYGSVWWFRKRIPDDLRPSLGKRELKFSLKGLNHEEARRAAIQAGALADQLFRTARVLKQPSPEHVEQLLANFRQRMRLIVAHSDEIIPTERDPNHHPERVILEIAADSTQRGRLHRFLADGLQELGYSLPEEGNPDREALLDDLAERCAMIWADIVRDRQKLPNAPAPQLSEEGLDPADQSETQAIQELLRINPNAKAQIREKARTSWIEDFANSDDPLVAKLGKALKSVKPEKQKDPSQSAVRSDVTELSATQSDNLSNHAVRHAAHRQQNRSIREVRSQMTLSQLVEPFFKRTAASDNAKTKGDYLLSAQWFDEILGKKPVGLIDRDDITFYLEILSEVPSNFTKIFKTDSVLTGIELNNGLDTPKPCLNPSTIIDKRFANVRAMFGWFERENYVLYNPCSNRGPDLQQRRRKSSRLPFEVPQLQRLFSAPLFVSARGPDAFLEAGNYKIRDHRFWVPLLLLYTGARSGEFGPLMPEHIIEVHGYPCIRITDSEDGLTADERGTLKSEAARRTVPINEELIRIGFLDFVEKAPRRRRLFQEWRPVAGYYSDSFSKFFRRLRVGMEVGSWQTTAHSFRHSLSRLCTSSEMPAETQDIIMGWEESKTARHSYKDQRRRDPFKAEIEAFRSLRYEGLDLSHISYS